MKNLPIYSFRLWHYFTSQGFAAERTIGDFGLSGWQKESLSCLEKAATAIVGKNLSSFTGFGIELAASEDFAERTG